MMKYMLCLLMTVLWAWPVSAQTIWQVAPGRSTIGFKVRYLLLFEVEGKFKKFEGIVVTQGDDFSDARIEVTIPVNSIYTGNRDRDQNLLGEAFFHADRFPTILFKSTTIVKTDAHTYTIHGDLTMRGVTKSIEMKVKYKDSRTLSGGSTRMRDSGNIPLKTWRAAS